LTLAQSVRRRRVRATWQPPPGPLPAGARGDPSLLPGPGETLDHLAGEWRIFQRRDGHRWSTDDFLTAWYACRLVEEQGLPVRRCVDLGAGIGSVALLVAWKLPQARVVGVEAQELSAALFERSVRFDGALERVLVRRGDLRDPAALPEAGVFDLATGSPPYLAEGQGSASVRPQCDPCRFERRGGVEDYARAAARALRPGGLFVLVHQWTARNRVREAGRPAGLALWRAQPVVFREGRPPHIAAYALRAASDPSAVEVEPELVVRTASGERSHTYRATRAWMGLPP
jgi:tRNA1(Val) A37 N6-methylase TrmN6